MKDFFTIKEFSKISGVEVSTLRYWDEIGLFTPAKRDNETQYRYYSPTQLILVNYIVIMRDLNVPLKIIEDMSDRRSPESMLELIDSQERLLDKEINKLYTRYSVMHTRRKLITRGMNVKESGVSVVHFEDTPYILGPVNEFDNDEAFYGPFARFCIKAEELRINLGYPVGGYYNDMDTFVSGPYIPKYFFSIDPNGNRYRKAGDYLVGNMRCYYGEFGDMPERMQAYAKEHSLKLTGPVAAVWLHDELCSIDQSQYLVQISVRVRNYD